MLSDHNAVPLKISSKEITKSKLPAKKCLEIFFQITQLTRKTKITSNSQNNFEGDQSCQEFTLPNFKTQ